MESKNVTETEGGLGRTGRNADGSITTTASSDDGNINNSCYNKNKNVISWDLMEVSENRAAYKPWTNTLRRGTSHTQQKSSNAELFDRIVVLYETKTRSQATVRKWRICLIQRSDCANVATAVLLFIFKRQLFKWKWFWFWISLTKCLHSIVVDTKCKIKWYYWSESCTKWKCQLRQFHHSSVILPECPLERVNCCEFVHVSPSLAVSLLSVKSDEHIVEGKVCFS